MCVCVYISQTKTVKMKKIHHQDEDFLFSNIHLGISNLHI